MLDALSSDERSRRHQLAQELSKAVVEISELSDGYTFRLGNDADTCRQTLEWILLERRCCPFLQFELKLTPAQDSVELSLRGRPGVKKFVAETLS